MLPIITDHLWHVHHDLRLAPGFWLPCRMTILALPDGQLALHSPVPFDDLTADAIAQLGDVSFIIAPSQFHHLFVPHAAQRFPDAQVWLAPGLDRKRPELPCHGLLTDDAQPTFRSHLDFVHVAGMPKLDEVAFFHHPSNTLVLTDLVFNLHQTRGALTPLILTLAGTRARFATSRLVLSAVRDHAACAQSLARILDQWPIARVLMAHGQHIEGPDVADRLRDAWAPLLAHA